MSENSTDNLTEKERNIVSLINSLAEAADDETTTQEAIDRIVGQIKSTTSESIKDNLEKAEKERQSVQFPSSSISGRIQDGIAAERAKMKKAVRSCQRLQLKRAPKVLSREEKKTRWV